MADRATTWAELFKAETGFEHMADTPEASLAWFKRWAEETCQRLDEALASQQREGRDDG